MKKLYLEFIRGAAAVTVLIYHFLELHTLSSHSKHFYFASWGTDAVIIFFILSGIVINISQTNNPKAKRDFMAGRLLRLYPQLVVGLLLGLLVLYITNIAIPSAGVIAGNFFMISAVRDYMINIVPCLQSNSPLWSLSYEIVFYLLFAISIGKYQKKAVVYWFLLSLAIMPVYYLKIGPDVLKHFVAVLAFSSIWLAGYYIYEYRNYFYADKYTALFSVGALPLISRMHISSLYYDPAKYLLFAIFAIPFFRYCLQIPGSGKKIRLYYLAIPYLFIIYTVFNQPYLTFISFAAYSLLPLVLIAVCFMLSALQLKNQITRSIESIGKIFGKYSYSIYVIHYPVLFLFSAVFHNAALILVLSLLYIAAIAFLLENYFQPAFVTYFSKQKSTHSFPGATELKTWRRFGGDVVLIRKIVLPVIAVVSWLLFNKY
jgi:peptidoglycan/LPS O-acetylase OafA/YrhL